MSQRAESADTVLAPAGAVIFCRVIDNFGDAGVTWRLSKRLRDLGLPVTLAQVGITTDEQLMKLVSAAEHIKEWSTGPEPAVREQFVAAIRKVDTLGAARLASAA